MPGKRKSGLTRLRPYISPRGVPSESSDVEASGAAGARDFDPMTCAFSEARAAMARGEVPIGAVIVHGGRIVSRAGNQVLGDRDPTAHAEILAIRRACLAMASERLCGCDIYVTLEPCTMCAAAISFARLRRLYFAAPDPKGGGVEHGARFFAQPTCHHAPEVYGGIRESEAVGMLRSFFAARR
jgi:tRNA(adenine34) deaminase